MSKKLRSGLTTGAHAHKAFVAVLEFFLKTSLAGVSHTTKMDNDDLDVTKGCSICVHLSDSLEDITLSKEPQTPFEYRQGENVLLLYAGSGVGVVTKKGLKISVGYPAINPRPRDAIFASFATMMEQKGGYTIYCSISVIDGENLAKQTANEKVGVVGGLSILGTTGVVKPVSSAAYLDSIETEIAVAVANGFETLYFTLGNSAYKKALEHFDEACVVEIGNYVYDAISLAQKSGVKKVVFLAGIGKMTKVAQGFKNTHNKFGVIDFKALQKDIEDALGYCVDIETTLTVKGVSQELEKMGLLEPFYTLITNKANKQLHRWFGDFDVEAVILEHKEVLGW